jgi:hypothetical protein
LAHWLSILPKQYHLPLESFPPFQGRHPG